MMRRCLDRNTRARSFRTAAALSLVVLCSPAVVGAQNLEAAVRALRESPAPAHRAAVLRLATSMPNDPSGALARLALGITDFEQRDFTSAIDNLRIALPRLPKLEDYISYYLAAARMELKDYAGVRRDLAGMNNVRLASPFTARSVLLAARALAESGTPADAIRLLREKDSELSQPEAGFTLARAYELVPNLAQAAAAYQRVYHLYPLSDSAARSGAALMTIKDAMGGSYPPPSAQLRIERCHRLLLARDYSRARAEYESAAQELSGAERDQALVGIGAVDFLRGEVSSAHRYLKSLSIAESEADARRLYYLAECARKLNADDEMLEAVNRLKRYPDSPWRLKALLSVANRFIVVNDSGHFEPLYRAVFESFPSDSQAPYSHWKVTWSSYLHRRADAEELLHDHLRRFPANPKASAAIYFLGRLAESDRNYPAARAWYDALVNRYPNLYYGELGRERLRQAKVIAANPSPKVIQFLQGIPFPEPKPVSAGPTAATSLRIERSRLLRIAGFDDLADSELRFGAKTDGQAHLLAMELARQADTPHQGLRYMKSLAPDYLYLGFEDAPVRFWQLLYPFPYRSTVVSNARQRSLDPFILAGLVRQESEFNPQAVSHANAYGLTQVVPATGRLLARKAGLRRFRANMLFQPETNLKLGSFYLRSMLDQWGGNWEQTLAAYNAGPNRVAEWLTWANYAEPAEFVETIPFTETREYVQSVLRNAAMYKRIYENNRGAAASDTEAPIKRAVLTRNPARNTPKKAATKKTRAAKSKKSKMALAHPARASR
jgi:soluble lytic murein transglycosylase